MTKRHELESAYFKGLHEMNGMDPDVARDLGFVTNPEEFEAVLDSHKRITPEIAAREAAHQENVVNFHLQTDAQRDFRPSSEQLAEADGARLAARKDIGRTALGQ